MPFRLTVVERAFELARSESCRNFSEIKRQLRREGYVQVDEQLFGRTLARDLNKLCESSRAPAADAVRTTPEP